MTVSFELNGREFLALNGGPEFTFSEAVSFQVCEDQDEVDLFWSKLGEGGEHGPRAEGSFGSPGRSFRPGSASCSGISTPPERNAHMTAMLGMKKLDIAELEQAADGAG
jgi:predicted 3-demethylubiquinone-9 3-methyltransferase (glyoxalase superfamily)